MIVGIDLGTTNSLIAVWQDGQARLLPNGLGESLTPSCVSLDEDDTILVGRAARDRLQTHPDRSAAVFKRYMGSNKTLRLGKREFRPEELSALVLKALKADAEAALGQPITEAVITVPAYFSEAQRRATRVAGQMAGLKVDRLLNEPTAAALAYGMHQMGSESRFLVFDLGGGTFDVSILEMFDGVMEVRASAGDNFLGGEDFANALVDLFMTRGAVPDKLRKDPAFMQRLQAQAEAAKRTLSGQPQANMSVWQGKTEYTMTVDEPALEHACAALLKRLRTPVERALRDANLRGSELDRVVLAGGATRMPMIRRLVTMMFGRFPSVDFNPDEVVALGAAVQAGLKAKDAALSEVVMTDVSPYSLGVEVSQRLSEHNTSAGHFDPIIERNSPVPISRVKRYFPIREGQALLELNVYQGEARMVRDNIHLGRLELALPRGLPQSDSGVDVRFTYDVNGLLQVETTLVKTQEITTLLIEGNPGMMSPEEITESLQALADLKIHPRDRLENRTLMARAERLYEQLRGDTREWLGQQILRFEQVLATQDKRSIEPNRQRFEDLLNQVERDSFIDGGEIGEPR
jgi:molecular chaperone HscC